MKKVIVRKNAGILIQNSLVEICVQSFNMYRFSCFYTGSQSEIFL